MLCNKKCSNQVQPTNGALYYRILTFAWHPGSEKPERPVFQPRDRGEVFWNTALLSIEQTSFLLLHECDYKVSDITMNNIGTATLRQPQFLYTSSIILEAAEQLLAAEQRTTMMDSNPQGLWLERLS